MSDGTPGDDEVSRQESLPVEDEPARGHPDLQGTLAWYASNAESLTPEDMAALGEMMERTGKSVREKRDNDELERRVAGRSEMKTYGERLEALEREVFDPTIQGVAGEIVRAAGFPTALWQRVAALEQWQRVGEDRLRAVEEKLSRPRTLLGRLFAWLGRPRRSKASPESAPRLFRAAQSTAGKPLP